MKLKEQYLTADGREVLRVHKISNYNVKDLREEPLYLDYRCITSMGKKFLLSKIGLEDRLEDIAVVYAENGLLLIDKRTQEYKSYLVNRRLVERSIESNYKSLTRNARFVVNDLGIVKKQA